MLYLDLSNRQISILEFIKEHSKSKGYPPSVREICESVNLSSPSTVHSHLKTLEKLGYLIKHKDIPRGIEVLNKDSEPNRINQEIINLPLVGCVTAGKPILAEENIEEYIPLPKSLVKGNDNFVLKVKGDSMINAGILDGDYVIVNKQHIANNNKIVVALIDNDSATVKRFFREDNKIRLQPENDSMSPMYFSDNQISILGIITGVFRIFK